MPNIIKEKLVKSKEKLKEKAKNFKPKEVISKLRDKGRTGSRRLSWLLLGVFLYFYFEWSVPAIIALYILLVCLLFVAAPFIFKFSPYIQKNMVFLPYVKWPGVVDFDDPHGSCDLPNTKNLYVDVNKDIKVGVWHILPASYDLQTGTDHDHEGLIQDDGKTVILYLHGNSANRAGAHRVELYKVLRNMDYHVICMDYRGYADSSQTLPNETGVVEDAKTVYEWVVARAGGDRDRVLVWGHSLGTGVAGHLVSLLSQEGISPTGLVLESPFNNIFDEVRNHPMCWVWSKMPWFDWFFTKSLADNDVGFVTDQRIALIDCPVLILHAEDDAVVPYKLGVALYETAQSCRSPDWGPVQFQSYSSDLCYGHKYICRDPGLPQLIRDFLEKCRHC